jgi:hypothetical protein
MEISLEMLPVTGMNSEMDMALATLPVYVLYAEVDISFLNAASICTKY